MPERKSLESYIHKKVEYPKSKFTVGQHITQQSSTLPTLITQVEENKLKIDNLSNQIYELNNLVKSLLLEKDKPILYAPKNKLIQPKSNISTKSVTIQPPLK